MDVIYRVWFAAVAPWDYIEGGNLIMNFLAMTRLFVALALLSGFTFGQSNLGTITGVVKDSTGSVVPGADVTIINTATGIAYDTRTNDEGV